MKTKLFSFLLLLFCGWLNAQVTFLTPYATAVTSTTASINVSMTLGNTYFISYQIATSSAGVAGSASLDSQNTFAGTYNLVKNLTTLAPNTTYYFRFKASDGTASSISSFTTLPLSPVISNVAATGISNNGATIIYTLNAQGYNTTSIVKYGLSATTMTNQVTGISATGTSNTNASIPLTGLSYNTLYYYQVEAVNANGTTTSQPLGTFITVVPTPTTEYTFDNTYNNTVGTNPFSSSNTNFVDDRHGNSTGAIQLVGAQSTATIPSTLLPTGASARTISLWYKTNSNSGYPGVFAYGANLNSQTFGMYLNPNGGPVFQGYSNDTDFGGSYAVDTWQHVVISYGGGVVKMYKNGVYISSANKSLNTALSTFKLGNSSVGMTFDDLKIYNFALSDAQVSNLYNYNSLSEPQPIISNVSASGILNNEATINYILNAQGFNTTSIVKYGLSATTMTNQVTGISATGTSNTNASIPLTGLTHNTLYYYQVEAVNVNGTTTSQIGTFTTQSGLPILTYNNSSATETTLTINYTLNANGSNTTSKVATFAGGLIVIEEVGVSATGTSDVQGSVTLTGLTPNTTYEIGIMATNSYGNQFIGFYYLTTSPSPNSLIAEYPFDYYYSNVYGTAPFNSNTGTSFTTDRYGVPNKALQINNTGTTATIPNLPYGNNPRTISFWAKTTSMNTSYNMTFSYGSMGIGNACGGSFNASNVEFFGYDDNLSASSVIANNTWYFFTYTYDGTNAKIYKDGTLLTTLAKNWNTLSNNDIFKLGIGVGDELSFIGAIDDLKIYNYVISDADVTSLYTNNTLSSSDFSQNNLKVAMYPNPVNDILNIDIENEIKSVEVYNIQGQRVIQSNSKQIETSSLNSGIYIVKITDENNLIAIQKVIKR
ncbi:LamG-like jellyroll fold domain-containing protein [Flavobacterium sp.]|jgi:hypothetical protein|uniref:T9SS type A sorting domain-containing protein n=1 Tax=Flavobacterium sp. TaxID=239 RepID=UPI0037C17303